MCEACKIVLYVCVILESNRARLDRICLVDQYADGMFLLYSFRLVDVLLVCDL
jgi:hypothetical protein